MRYCKIGEVGTRFLRESSCGHFSVEQISLAQIVILAANYCKTRKSNHLEVDSENLEVGEGFISCQPLNCKRICYHQLATLSPFHQETPPSLPCLSPLRSLLLSGQTLTRWGFWIERASRWQRRDWWYLPTLRTSLRSLISMHCSSSC